MFRGFIREDITKRSSKIMTIPKNTISTAVKKMRKPAMLAVIAFALAVFAALPASARLSANRLSANRLSPFSAATNSAAASQLAANRLSIGQSGQNLYTANPQAVSSFMATEDGREVLGFIVSCAMPEGSTLAARLPDNSPFEFFGELGLANEWLTHPLKKAGRGWVSACLFARISANDVPIPISFRGQHQELGTDPGERASWTLEEGAFYGDYFVAPGEPVQWIACRGRDQAVSEIGGLIDRDCTEPDPLHPGKTVCGLTYAGDCDAPTLPACHHLSPQGYYSKCADHAGGDESNSDLFRQVITVFALGG